MKEVKVKTMSHYKFRSLVFLEMIDPTNVGGRNHLVLTVQHQGIRKKDRSTPTNNVLLRRDIENRWKDKKSNLYMEQYNVTINIASNMSLGAKSPRVSYDVLQPVGAVDMRLNNEKPHF